MTFRRPGVPSGEHRALADTLRRVDILEREKPYRLFEHCQSVEVSTTNEWQILTGVRPAMGNGAIRPGYLNTPGWIGMMMHGIYSTYPGDVPYTGSTTIAYSLRLGDLVLLECEDLTPGLLPWDTQMYGPFKITCEVALDGATEDGTLVGFSQSSLATQFGPMTSMDTFDALGDTASLLTNGLVFKTVDLELEDTLIDTNDWLDLSLYVRTPGNESISLTNRGTRFNIWR